MPHVVVRVNKEYAHELFPLTRSLMHAPGLTASAYIGTPEGILPIQQRVTRDANVQFYYVDLCANREVIEVTIQDQQGQIILHQQFPNTGDTDPLYSTILNTALGVSHEFTTARSQT